MVPIVGRPLRRRPSLGCPSPWPVYDERPRLPSTPPPRVSTGRTETDRDPGVWGRGKRSVRRFEGDTNWRPNFEGRDYWGLVRHTRGRHRRIVDSCLRHGLVSHCFLRWPTTSCHVARTPALPKDFPHYQFADPTLDVLLILNQVTLPHPHSSFGSTSPTRRRVRNKTRVLLVPQLHDSWPPVRPPPCPRRHWKRPGTLSNDVLIPEEVQRKRRKECPVGRSVP